jgi:hypothetical protein
VSGALATYGAIFRYRGAEREGDIKRVLEAVGVGFDADKRVRLREGKP